ncbi:protein TolR [Desulforegula conservatrix]|uniref:protein TolR n=1 Tax=Desulforegula conservatrix TaxID=153026 RepID=UPI0004285640|nr:protein TolR [Desulforegula conservatrix]
MGFSANSGDDNLMSEINVTPFVDVMLVLLIIFMVTAPMMAQGINVALPQATAEALPSDNTEIIVSLDKDGKVFINETQVAIELLQKNIKDAVAAKPDKKVYLNADKRVPYGDVVKVMAEVKAAGIEKLGMVTQPEEDKKSN